MPLAPGPRRARPTTSLGHDRAARDQLIEHGLEGAHGQRPRQLAAQRLAADALLVRFGEMNVSIAASAVVLPGVASGSACRYSSPSTRRISRAWPSVRARR